MPNIERNFEIRSEEVQDILGRPPKWTIRWGSTVIFIIIIMLVGISWFIKYPSIVSGPVVISPGSSPVRIPSAVQGTIIAVFVNDGDTVKTGDILAQIMPDTISPIKNEIRRKYFLRTPLNGKLVFTEPLTPNLKVIQGKELFVVVPTGKYYTCWMRISITNFGKIKQGQKVKIRLDNFPYQEFGQIVGAVQEISDVPIDGLYNVKISLPKNRKSSYNKTFTLKPEMTGNAEIVTEDVRLFERFFFRVKSLLKN